MAGLFQQPKDYDDGYKRRQIDSTTIADNHNSPLLHQTSDISGPSNTDKAVLISTAVQGAEPDETPKSKLKRCCRKLSPEALCPKYNVFLRLVTCINMLLLLWGVSYTILRDAVLPDSELFSMAVLFVLAFIAGWILSFIQLPPLLGMLIVGIILRNVGLFNMTGVYVQAVSTLRLVAMVVILTKAGLGLDAAALRTLSVVVLRLAFIPCIVEAITVAVMSHFILGYSLLWGFLLGFVIAAVSPAVVVPSLLMLKEEGYGEDKGISTLVIAASSIDDVLAISGFGVVLGIIFSHGELLQQILQGPIDVAIGLSFGICWGIFLMYLPHKDDRWVVGCRAFLLGAGGLFSVFGSTLIGYSGAGALGCIIAAFVASCGWKSQGWTSSYHPVIDIYSMIWLIFQPVLFGLIGTEINVRQLDLHTVLYGLGVLAVGLIFRITASWLATWRTALNTKERIFVAIAWFPKATVQAALGPVALDFARQKGAPEDVVEKATQILEIAVLAILITAPIGAIGILSSGPHLLGRVVPENTMTEEAPENTRTEESNQAAALSPVALDIARETGADSDVIALSSQVLTIAVISTLVTAPVGAVGMYIAGPRLLSKQPAELAQEVCL